MQVSFVGKGMRRYDVVIWLSQIMDGYANASRLSRQALEKMRLEYYDVSELVCWVWVVWQMPAA